MVLDEELCRGAQKYANLLARRDAGLQHFGGLGPQLGENLYWSSYGGDKMKAAVKYWYDEKVNGKHCKGHYTQLVWKSSKRLGVAYAKSRSGKTYVVTRYSPAGNMLGAKYFRENVSPNFVYPCPFY